MLVLINTFILSSLGLNMKKNFPYILPLGDCAITIHFGDDINADVNKKVQQLFQYLKNESVRGITDIVPAYASVTLVYDVWVIEQEQPNAYDFIVGTINNALLNLQIILPPPTRKVAIPVCYDCSFGIDLETMAAEKNMTIKQIINLHTAVNYKVYMIGFLPGFAYMGSVHEKIAMPRKPTPRQHIVAGSVGIAGLQTGIYPLDSPGGWNIIGQTPLQLFDPNSENPCLLQAGDEVQFIPISSQEFFKIQSANEYKNY
jgi:inhibitor of KinA